MPSVYVFSSLLRRLPHWVSFTKRLPTNWVIAEGSQKGSFDIPKRSIVRWKGSFMSYFGDFSLLLSIHHFQSSTPIVSFSSVLSVMLIHCSEHSNCHNFALFTPFLINLYLKIKSVFLLKEIWEESLTGLLKALYFSPPSTAYSTNDLHEFHANL